MRSYDAFSLLEMLIALSIVAILLTLSFPTWQPLWTQTNDEILQAELLQTINFAKQEAQIREVPIALCKSNRHLTCSGNWLDGQLIFVNEEEDGIVHDPSAVLRVKQMYRATGVLHWRSFPHYRNYLLFLPNGLLRNDNGTFWYCNKVQTLPRWAIVLSKSGRVHVLLPNKQGEIKDSHGQQLLC